MEREIGFSIIVPMYNMEDYVKKCISSIISQDYSNYEVIIIDDGSKDESLNIANKLAKEYEQIKVYHKENGGICTAIKLGLLKATKEFIVFVDSDDTLKRGSLSKIAYEIEQSGNVDVIQFGLEFTDGENVLYSDVPDEETIFGNKDIIKNHYERFNTPSLACRVFSRKLFENVEFYGKNIGIDELLIVQLLGKANCLKSINNAYYSVYVRPNSVSRNTISEERIREYIKIYKKIIEVAGKIDNNSLNFTLIKYMKLLISLIHDYKGRGQVKRTLHCEYLDSYNKVCKLKEYKHERVKFRIKNMLFYYFVKSNVWIGGIICYHS